MTAEKRSMDERMASVEGDISHLSAQMSDLSKAMSRGFDKLSNSSKIQWSPVVAVVVAVVMLGGGLGGVFLSQINQDLHRIEQAGTANSIRCIETLEKSVEILHREMQEKEGFAVSSLMVAEAHFKQLLDAQERIMEAKLDRGR